MQFKRLETITFLNYFNLKDGEQPKQTTVKNTLVVKHENSYIIKEFDKSYLYIVNGVLIANRCGYSIELLKKFIETKCKPLDYEMKHQIKMGKV